MSKEVDAFIRYFKERQSREGLKRARETQNPLYLWEMIETFVGWSGHGSAAKNPHGMTELPNWVVWFLDTVAYKLLAMGRGHARDSKENPHHIPAAGDETITPKEALAETLRVMGFVRPGRNAFAAYRRDQLRENAAICIEFNDDPAEVARYLGVKTPRSLRRELAKRRKKPMPHRGSRTNSSRRN
jgi:hypothetical protein